MKKLDAQLVAYLANEMKFVEHINGVIEKTELNGFQFSQPKTAIPSTAPTPSSAPFILPNKDVHEIKRETFKSIRYLKLEMEALKLQSHGVKCMELLETEICPIFTIECQLSQELIKNVPHYDMFHVMQFESEKFNKMTQCTRFGQFAQREIKLVYDEEKNSKLNLGSICFTVWWREPGTCLNEMLGIGSLNLVELYYASLTEQCKRVKILRRGYHMASLYFKIILQHDNMKATHNSLSASVREADNDLFEQNIRNSNELSINAGIIKPKPKQQEQKSNSCGDTNTITSTTCDGHCNVTLTNKTISKYTGEYSEDFFHQKHTKIE